MGCPAQCVLGENLTFTVQARDGTGAPANATGSVSYSVYEDETSTAILTGTMTQLASQTGFYSEQIACTTANGFERYKSYTIRITATVSSISLAKAYTILCVGVEDTPSATSGALTTMANFKSYIGETSTDYDTIIAALITRATSAIEEYCNRILRSDVYREVFDGDGTTELMLSQFPVTNIAYISVGMQDVLKINNSSSDAYNASVTVVTDDSDPSISETMTLAISGGTNDGSDDLTLSSYTITELAAAIVALGKGWSATVNVSDWGVWESVELMPVSGLGCLDTANAYVQTPYKAEIEYKLEGQTQSPYNNNVGVLHLPTGFTQGTQNIIVKYTAGYGTTPSDLEQICIDLVNIYFKGRNKDLTVKAEKLGDHSITHAEDARTIPKSIQIRLGPYKKWR
jgi:hypothetical protein